MGHPNRAGRPPGSVFLAPPWLLKMAHLEALLTHKQSNKLQQCGMHTCTQLLVWAWVIGTTNVRLCIAKFEAWGPMIVGCVHACGGIACGASVLGRPLNKKQKWHIKHGPPMPLGIMARWWVLVANFWPLCHRMVHATSIEQLGDEGGTLVPSEGQLALVSQATHWPMFMPPRPPHDAKLGYWF